MSNVINFPSDKSRISAEEVLTKITEAHANGDVKHILIVTMDEDTNVRFAMSTIPAHCAVYMASMAELSIEELMRDTGLIK